MSNDKNEIVPVAKYAALATTPEEVLAIVQQNIGNDQITAQDLDRVTLPLGGITNWQIPTLDGEESLQYIEGIIVHHSSPRAYWEKSLDEGEASAPPDCSSEDSQWGVGTPGGIAWVISALCIQSMPIAVFQSGPGLLLGSRCPRP